MKHKISHALKSALLALVAFALRFPKTVMLAHALLVLGSLGVIRGLTFDTSIDVFFDQKSDLWTRSDQLEETFDIGERSIIALHAEDGIFTRERLEAIRAISERLETIGDVMDVVSLTTVNNTKGEEDSFIVEKLIEDIPEDADALLALRERTLNNPLYVGNIISADGRTAGIVLETENVPSDIEDNRERIVRAVEAILDDEMPDGMTVHLAGPVPMGYFYSLHLSEDLGKFLPLSFLAMIVLLFATFRRLRWALMPLLAVTVTLIYTMASIGLYGYKLNNVTVVVPPLILAIAVAVAIHFVAHAMRIPDAVRNAGIFDTARLLIMPCFLTSVTTSVGFFSLMVSRSPAIRQMGLISGTGVIFSFIVAFSLLPALMRGRRRSDSRPPAESLAKTSPPPADRSLGESGTPPASPPDGPMDRMLTGIGRFNERRPGLILALAGIVAFLTLFGIRRMNVESSLLAQLHPSMRIHQSTVFIDQNLTGSMIAYVSLKHTDMDAFKEPNRLRVIEAIQRKFDTFPDVVNTLSIADFLKDMNAAFHNENREFFAIPDSAELVAQYALLYGDDDLDNFMTSSWDWGMILVSLSEHGAEALEAIFDEIRAYAATIPDLDVAIEILGPAVRMADGANTVVDGQVQSLFLAMTAIFLMMFLVFRSVSVGLISIVPNLVPLLINFGIMGLFGIPLDTATSLIAAIGIGIIVDDTIHYTYGFGEALHACGGDYVKAMHESLRRKGRAIVFTSLVLACSFGILTASVFPPTFQFGLLSAMVMINALFTDLFLLPVLFVKLKPHFARMA